MQVKLNKFPQSDNLSEIFQSVDIKFSFVKQDGNEFTQITDPCKCRDFLGDCLWSKATGTKVSIYGFKYDHKDAPYDEDALKLSLTFPDKESLENFKKNWSTILKEKETTGSTDITWAFHTDDELTIVIIADKAWQQAPWKLSLFTFYLKLASYESMETLQEPEDEYIGYLTPEVEKKLLSHVNTNEEYYHEDMSQAHNYSGFVATIQGNNDKWHKEIFGGKA